MIPCDEKNKLPIEAYSEHCKTSEIEYFSKDIITDVMKSSNRQRNILLKDLLHQKYEEALFNLSSVVNNLSLLLIEKDLKSPSADLKVYPLILKLCLMQKSIAL